MRREYGKMHLMPLERETAEISSRSSHSGVPPDTRHRVYACRTRIFHRRPRERRESPVKPFLTLYVHIGIDDKFYFYTYKLITVTKNVLILLAVDVLCDIPSLSLFSFSPSFSLHSLSLARNTYVLLLLKHYQIISFFFFFD